MCSSAMRQSCVFIIFIVLSIFIVGCNSESGTPVESPPPDVMVASVLSRSVRTWDEFNGRVRAIQTVELRPRVSG